MQGSLKVCRDADTSGHKMCLKTRTDYVWFDTDNLQTCLFDTDNLKTCLYHDSQLLYVLLHYHM